jgi:nucleoside-diphosphate-sugar epimerase
VSAYVGDGTQRWPAVHRDDAATLFRLALEQAPPGSVLHAVGDEADSMRAIAEVIGRRLGVPVESAPAANFGPLGAIFAADQPSSSALTRRRFGWNPTHPSLLEDLETGDYPE